MFERGDIWLIRTPVNGRLGIKRLYAMLLGGLFGVRYDVTRELWLVMLNRRRNRLRILHLDAYGYDLTVRINRSGLFRVILDESPGQKLTRAQLRELCLTGTLEEASSGLLPEAEIVS